MRLLVSVFVASLALAASARAQTSTGGSVRGYIYDEQKAVLPGATIKATSPNATRPSEAVSDDHGYYRLVDLAPGEYDVEVALQGFVTNVQKGIHVRAGLNLGLDIRMAIGPMAERVEVVADTPMLERSTPTQALNVDGDFQRSVPLSSRRHWHDYLALVPGTVSTELGIAPYNVHGADASALVIQLDGANIGAPQQSTNFYVGLSPETLADVQIKTAGVDASAPLGNGAVISMVSKAGTNTITGAGGVVFQPKRWNDNNNPGGTVAVADVLEPDVSLGGPLVRDRFWFFGSYRYLRTRTGISRTPTQLASLRAVVPGFEPFDATVDAHYPFGKLTLQPTPVQRVDGFFQRDRYPSITAAPTTAIPLSRSDLGGNAWSVRWSSIWKDAFTSRAGVSYSSKRSGSALLGSGPSKVIHPSMFASSGRAVGTGAIATLGNAQAAATLEDYRYSISGDTTYFRRGWYGTHDVQAGFLHQPSVLRSRQVAPEGGAMLEELVPRDPANLTSPLVVFHRRVIASADFEANDLGYRDTAVYVQDAWRPGRRITLSAGVRVDHVGRTDKLFDVTTQRSTEVGPRLGFNADLTGDGHHAVRATWGRVHDVVSLSGLSAGSVNPAITDFYDLNLDGVFEAVFVNPAVNALSTNIVIDPDYHQPFTDEWTVGYRGQTRGALSVEANVVHRAFRERQTGADTNGIYEGGVFRGYRDVSQNEILLITNNTSYWPVYTAFEAVVAKQTGRARLIGSYTRQWRHLEGGWQPNDPASIIQPGAFPNNKSFGDVRGRSSDWNTLTLVSQICCGGSLWRDHALRLAASVDAPWGINVASTYTVQSGLWLGVNYDRIAAADPRFGPPTVTLSNGRVVSNPLATTLRFANATRGDGQLTLPATHIWNMRFVKKVHARGIRLEPALDLINIPNAGVEQFAIPQQSTATFSPNYGKGSQRQLPRSMQLSVRVTF